MLKGAHGEVSGRMIGWRRNTVSATFSCPEIAIAEPEQWQDRRRTGRRPGERALLSPDLGVVHDQVVRSEGSRITTGLPREVGGEHN
jgi:hypothetical protein